MTASSDPALKRLHGLYGAWVQFVMLHVREAHPGERCDQARSEDKKLRLARDLKARDQLPWPIAVGDLEGSVHRARDEKPNAAYLADRDGKIVFRALWAGDSKALEQALQAVAQGRRPAAAESRRRMAPVARGLGMMRETLEHSGPRAERDIWRAAPPMAAIAWLAALYRPLPPGWRVAAAVATIGGALGATAALLLARRQARSSG